MTQLLHSIFEYVPVTGKFKLLLKYCGLLDRDAMPRGISCDVSNPSMTQLIFQFGLIGSSRVVYNVVSNSIHDKSFVDNKKKRTHGANVSVVITKKQ